MLRCFCLFLAAASFAGPAIADAGAITDGVMGGLMHGFLVPEFIVPLMTLGLWATFLGRPAIFALPLSLPVFLAVGAALSSFGVTVPLPEEIEICLTVAAVALGLLVLIGVEPPLWIALVLVGLFGALLGYQHGSPDLHADTVGMTFAAGFAAAVLGYAVLGALAGLLATFFFGPLAVRFAGAAATAFAVYTLSHVM